ncbi:uncharacterized protein BHQ10_000898 [Talaromyces amestolkiae]|uniref:Rhodopsin domain-containing protein n=1 Tax=Talaromyces amestolkiae TaxID=1196081 RepID=A0A364KMV7_TALAM|nr:uncharacterized protein BHQ10_000898 [Talaromyces amestolkiae]RAO64886.1 hypothetical protein BHQ10_000898 [Talaromyces amestolkiae]
MNNTTENRPYVRVSFTIRNNQDAAFFVVVDGGDFDCFAMSVSGNSEVQLYSDEFAMHLHKPAAQRDDHATKNVTSTLCGAPIRDRTAVVSVAGLAGGALAIVFFLLRMVTRLPRFGVSFGLDDAVLTFVIGLAIVLTYFSYVLASHGLGKDMWTVPFDNITHILYIYYIDEDIYLSILPLTKISILLFYLRVFPQRSFRITTYIVIAMNLCYLIAFVLVSVFQCHPIDAAWLRWDGEHPAKCQNINAQGWASAAINMFLDIVTMVLPLRELSKLSMSLKKKMQLMIMFTLGLFVTLVSILRLHSLVEFANTTNLTWDYVQLGYWSTIEVDVGIICACLPAVRKLLRGVFPNVFASTVHSGAKTPAYSHTRSAQSGGGKRFIKNGEYELHHRDAALEEGDAMPLVQLVPYTLIEIHLLVPVKAVRHVDHFVNKKDGVYSQDFNSRLSKFSS